VERSDGALYLLCFVLGVWNETLGVYNGAFGLFAARSTKKVASRERLIAQLQVLRPRDGSNNNKAVDGSRTVTGNVDKTTLSIDPQSSKRQTAIHNLFFFISSNNVSPSRIADSPLTLLFSLLLL